MVAEDLPAAPGHIRAFDVHTGKLRWVFHTIPLPGEFGYDTWPKDAWKYIGGANSWAGLTLDRGAGFVFVPTGSAAFDFYGANRMGDNLFANCLLALDAETGKRSGIFSLFVTMCGTGTCPRLRLWCRSSTTAERWMPLPKSRSTAASG